MKDTASSVFDASILTGPLTNAAVADSYNLDRDYDYSTGDIPHYFGASLVWDVPVGMGRAKEPGGLLGGLASDWSLASVVTLQSGVPVAVTQANSLGYARLHDPAAEPGRGPRAARRRADTGPLVQHSGVRDRDQFQIGTASRNPVRGPSYRDVDLALMRLIRLGQERTVELRGEVFNLLNTVNYGAPAATQGAANFGTITSALDPRVVQLAVKFSF